MQAGGLLEIALADVAVDDYGAILAHAGEEHLDLGRRRVLRFVEQHEGVAPRTPAHHLERDHLDMAALDCDLVGRRADALLDGLDHRDHPWGELILERARKVAKRASARHVGPGENDLADAPAAIE